MQEWYGSQCDGQWEHQCGVSIETIDNPGWRLAIDLSFTDLVDRSFTEVQHNHDNNVDWYVCRVKDEVFEAACSPNHLGDVISIFLKWARTSTCA
ncbi:immunity 53 family protein [Bradyrhizobium sp. STM 3557]|uniref:immunity 53 family protein n=1 Tax=Bradyrhizobium sp. STM 3557 TaxID=578920 RepID=UPI00388EEA43